MDWRMGRKRKRPNDVKGNKEEKKKIRRGEVGGRRVRVRMNG